MSRKSGLSLALILCDPMGIFFLVAEGALMIAPSAVVDLLPVSLPRLTVLAVVIGILAAGSMAQKTGVFSLLAVLFSMRRGAQKRKVVSES